jgi:HSP20 family molecular chaperone IbpA
MEISFGDFESRIALPASCDPSRAKASDFNGFFTI